MRRIRILLGATLMLALVCLCSSTAFAQYGASLQGTVTDKSGAVVSGANVTATNHATGVSKSATTGDSGFYRITGLAPGGYTVVVEAQGFKKSSTDNVAVAGESLRGFDVTLVPTQVQESVTVSAAADPLSTEDATLSSALSTREIDALPKFGRDPYELIRFSPGVFGDGARQGNGNSQVLPQQVGPGGSNFSLFQTENAPQIVSNGQRVTANTYTLDGVSVNSLSHGGAAVVTPNPESVAELITISGFSSAQDGRNSGAQVKTLSKSGTNNFHGSAFVKFDDKGLNSFNKYYGPTNVPLSEITCERGTPSEFKIVAKHCPSRVDRRYRDYAGSFGGPIIKDHLFFFFSYEGNRESGTSISRDIKLEAPAFRDYVISANPGSIAAQIFQTPGIAPRITTTTSEIDCCSLIPGYGLGKWYVAGNQVGQAIGNGPDGISDWGIYDLTVPFRTRGDQYNGRVDFTHGNNQFFASTYIVRLDQLGGGLRPLEDLTFKPSNYVGTIGWTRTFGGAMLNELRFNGTRFFFDQTAPVGETNFGIPQIRIFDFDANGFGDPGRVIGISRSSTTPSKGAQNTYAFADTFSWVRKTHALKFGVQITREQNNNDQPGGERPDYQFRGLLNFANDACCFFEGVTVDPRGGALSSQRYFRTADYAVFVQDDWKFRPNLTINLGLRWEYFSPDTEAKNVLSNYVQGTQGFVDGSVKLIHPLYKGDYNNFGPRVGFAWSPVKYDNKVVFRGGFGVLYNRYFGDVFQNARQNTPFTAEVGTCCFFDPRDPNDPSQGVTGPPPGSNILYAIGANRQANSYPVNPGLSLGVAPDGALCANVACDGVIKVDLFGALPNTRTPYVYSYNFQTQYEPIRHLVATLGYQGSRSRKLVRTIDVNRLIPGDTFDGVRDEKQTASADGTPCGPSNPSCPADRLVGNNRFGRIFIPLDDVNASYDAAIFQLKHRFSGGLELAGAYTWSHTIDTVSYEIGFQQTDPSNQSLNRGSSDYDVRHNFVLSGLWEIPFLRTRKDFVGYALGGWTISGVMSKHSGLPFTALIGACDQSHDRNGDSYCPDMPFSYTGGIINSPSKQDWINGVFPDPAASFPGVQFIPDPSVKGPGCRCRNIFSGPGYTSIDMSVGKDFAFPSTGFLGEAARLEVRANFFNVFNILNLQPLIPATSSTDILNGTDFGRSIDGQAGRVVELQARFVF
jgi:hypothetical protein